uniref:Uncharacterized protein MANES_05G199500 n=1 Tax=Rhizophora mucronata TaxID=61149 RepID=A0A2P2MNG1_RHIMU
MMLCLILNVFGEAIGFQFKFDWSNGCNRFPFCVCVCFNHNMHRYGTFSHSEEKQVSR